MKYLFLILIMLFSYGCATLGMQSSLTDCAKACKTKCLKTFETDDVKCECLPK